MKTSFTHKGWFFLCPVYLCADIGEGMPVTARHPWLDWWFDLNMSLFGFFASFSPHEEPFPLTVTGRLKTPVVFEDSQE